MVRRGVQRADRYSKRTKRELDALRKARLYVADVAELVVLAEEHLREGRFENASSCLRLIEQHASIGREEIGTFFNR